MKKVVIIEDDVETLNLLQNILHSEGYHVIAYLGRNSIKGIIINRPDLVLVDNKLEDGYGHELIAEIKSNEQTRHIPVILTSGYADLAEIAGKCGADAYMAKPFDLGLLISEVSQAINHN